MSIMKKYSSAIIIGLIVGVLTLLGQACLPVNLNFLANSGAVWLIPAFLFSFFIKENKLNSMLTTIICLLGCVYGYYIFEAIHNHHPFCMTEGALMWSIIALLAGSIFGIGAYFANQEDSKLKYCGMNLLPAVFTAEGIDNLLHISGYLHMIPAVIMKIIIGMILYLVIIRKNAAKTYNLLSYGIITILGIVAYTGLLLLIYL